MRLMQCLSITVLISVGTIACSPASKAKKTTGGSAATEIDDVTACADTTGTAPTFKSAIPETRTTAIDPNSASFLTAFNGGANETICQFLNSENKEVVIYQFAGIMCQSCKAEADAFTKGIATSPNGSKMVHVVIFVDNPESEEWQDQDFAQTRINDFMLSNTQNKALPRFEPSKLLFKQYNLYDFDSLKFGSAIAINKFGQQYFVNDAERIHEMVEKVEQLVP